MTKKETQLVTAAWRNGGCSASYDSLVVGSSVVLRLNICAKKPARTPSRGTLCLIA
jgi:hypothetical protein